MPVLRKSLISLGILAAACGAPEPTWPDAGDPPDGGAIVDVPDAGPALSMTERLCSPGAERIDNRRMPLEIRTAAADLAVKVVVGRIEVWVRGSSRLTENDSRLYGDRACQALAFDVDDLGIAEDDEALRKPVRLVVLDSSAYAVATEAPGTFGVSFSAYGGASDVMVIPEGALLNPEEMDDTLAHELTHIIQGRVAPDDEQVPWWATEGLAVHEGARFGKQEHGVPSGYVRGTLDWADGSDARETFARYGLEDLTTNLGEVGHDQGVSGFYVEWLRARGPDEQPLGNAHRMLLEAMRVTVDGDGQEFEAAFRATFGLEQSVAAAAFEAFLDATEGDLAERYRGTVFAP
jgi:hypothetical protein